HTEFLNVRGFETREYFHALNELSKTAAYYDWPDLTQKPRIYADFRCIRLIESVEIVVSGLHVLLAHSSLQATVKIRVVGEVILDVEHTSLSDTECHINNGGELSIL